MTDSNVKIIEYPFTLGYIKNIINDMIEYAKDHNSLVRSSLNRIVVVVAKDSDVELIYRDQQRGQNEYHNDIVGPYPTLELTSQQLQNDSRISAEHVRVAKIRQAEFDAEQQAELDVLNELLAKAGGFEVKDLQKLKEWEDAQKSDPYGLAVFEFASRWARLMQLSMTGGKTLENCVEEASHLADANLGISGFMYGCAKSILIECWIHGDALEDYFKNNS
jgi:hypothetical protein